MAVDHHVGPLWKQPTAVFQALAGDFLNIHPQQMFSLFLSEIA